MTTSKINNRYLIQYLSVIAVSLLFWVVGILSGLGPILAILEEDGYHDIPPISKTASGWTVNALNIGIVVGSIISSYMSDMIGRKYTMLAATIPQILSYLLLLYANNVYLIHASCAIRGIYVALTYGIVPTYVGEITSAKVRGPSTVFGLFLLRIGALLGGIVHSITSISRATIILGVLSICTVPFLFMIPESPYYYLSKKRDNDCNRVLKKLRRDANVDMEFLEMQTTWNKMEKSKNVSWAKLITNKLNLRVLFIVLGASTVQTFSGYSPLNNYTNVIINEAGLNLSLLAITLLINFVAIISTAASLFSVESLGRRILYIIICVMSILSLGMLGASFFLEHYFTSILLKILKTIGILLLNSAQAYGMGFFPNLIAAELFPLDIKAKGTSLALIIQSIQQIMATIAYDKLYSTVDYLPFFIFFILTVIGLIWGYFCIPETKNKTLPEIQKDLNLKT